MGGSKRILHSLLVCLLLAAATFAIYWQVVGHDFVNYDDNIYVTRNRHVQAGLTRESVKWAFTEKKTSANWHPLTWLSHMLDVEMYGPKAMGHHLTSVLLHTAASILLFLALSKMTGSLWRSAFVAGLFALHPAHVESVAWVAERKDVLSGLFWMLTMLFYAYYAARPSVGRYVPVFVSLALGLMAKPMLVSLPFILVLLDYWPLGRLQVRDHRLQGESGRFSILNPRSAILEKLPLFALMAGSCIVTVMAQRAGDAIPPSAVIPFRIRAANAVVACMNYTGKAFWPADLAVFYPHPGTRLAVAAVAASAVGLVLISLAVYLLGRTRPYLRVGWLWFVIALVPVIGLVQVGAHGMADRYTYLPFIGLSIMLTWGLGDLFAARKTPDTGRLSRKARKRERKEVEVITVSPAARGLAVFGLAALAGLGACAHIQTGHWRNSITLFTHAAKVTERNALAYLNLANAQLAEGDLAAAVDNYEKSLDISPNFAKTWNGYGSALTSLRRLDEAEEKFRQAVELDPSFAEAHANLGIALAGLDRIEEAIDEFESAIRLKPDIVEARINLGAALSRKGLLDDAIGHFHEALRLDPRRQEPHYNLAGVYFYRQEYAKAWAEVHALQDLGGEMEPSFIAALSERMPDPYSR